MFAIILKNCWMTAQNPKVTKLKATDEFICTHWDCVLAFLLCLFWFLYRIGNILREAVLVTIKEFLLNQSQFYRWMIHNGYISLSLSFFLSIFLSLLSRHLFLFLHLSLPFLHSLSPHPLSLSLSSIVILHSFCPSLTFSRTSIGT